MPSEIFCTCFYINYYAGIGLKSKEYENLDHEGLNVITTNDKVKGFEEFYTIFFEYVLGVLPKWRFSGHFI